MRSGKTKGGPRIKFSNSTPPAYRGRTAQPYSVHAREDQATTVWSATESPPTLAALPVTTSVANTSVSLIQLYSLSVIFVQKVSVFWLQYRAMSLNNPFNGRLPNGFQLLDVRKSQARREIGVDRTAQSNSLVYQCSTCGPCQAIN